MFRTIEASYERRNRHAAFTFHILHHDAKSTLISGYLLSFP